MTLEETKSYLALTVMHKLNALALLPTYLSTYFIIDLRFPIVAQNPLTPKFKAAMEQGLVAPVSVPSGVAILNRGAIPSRVKVPREAGVAVPCGPPAAD